MTTMQSSLSRAAKNLPPERVQAICSYLESAKGLPAEDQCKAALGAAIVESALLDQGQVLTRHLNERFANYPKMTMFIYGHTHQMQNLGSINGVSLPKTSSGVTEWDSCAIERRDVRVPVQTFARCALPAEITSETRGRKHRPASAGDRLEPKIAGTIKALEYGPLAVRLVVSTVPVDPGRDHHRQA